MRPIFPMIAVACLAGSGWAIAAPAAATDKTTAMALCEANRYCRSRPAPGGGTDIFVGNNYVFCPATGECICVACNHPVPDRRTDAWLPSATTDVATLLR